MSGAKDGEIAFERRILGTTRKRYRKSLMHGECREGLKRNRLRHLLDGTGPEIPLAEGCNGKTLVHLKGSHRRRKV